MTSTSRTSPGLHRVSWRLALAVAVSDLLCSVASAQTVPQPLVESIEVRVVNIDVVVTNRKGLPVTGLSASDFEVLENGKPRPITNFSEIRSADAETAMPAGPDSPPTPAAPVPPRQFIVFVDNASLQPLMRNRIFTAVRKFVESNLQPNDEVMLASWNHRLDVRSKFTSDRRAIDSAIEQLSKSTAGAGALVMQKRQAEEEIRTLVQLVDAQALSPSDAFGQAMSTCRAYAERLAQAQRGLAGSLEALMSTVSGAETRKVLIFVGKDMPLNPGVEMYQYADEQFNRVLRTADSGLQRMSINGSRLQEQLGNAANRHGITLYMLYAESPDEGNIESPTPVSSIASQLEFVNNFNSFQAIAKMTGGLAFGNSTNFEGMLESVRRDLESYYSLGYRPDDRASEGSRKLKVRTRNPELVLRYRESFTPSTMDEEMANRAIANLFTDAEQPGLPVEMTVGRPAPSSRGRMIVPVEVRIPASAFTLLPDGDHLSGSFSAYFGVADAEGRLSDVTRQTRILSVRTLDAAALEGQYYRFSMNLEMRRMENTISVAILDRVSNQTGFERAVVTPR